MEEDILENVMNNKNGDDISNKKTSDKELFVEELGLFHFQELMKDNSIVLRECEFLYER